MILYFFWADGCPHCAKQKEFLNILKKKYPQLHIKDYEVWYNPASRQLLQTMAKAYNINPTGVPVTFIGNKALVGFSEKVANEIESVLRQCLKSLCEDPLYYKNNH
ncbi:MAG: glutaredoxin domain-containing protein [Thermodesulfovibrionaceae bacterium]